jgi:hypothetical protein
MLCGSNPRCYVQMVVSGRDVSVSPVQFSPWIQSQPCGGLRDGPEFHMDKGYRHKWQYAKSTYHTPISLPMIHTVSLAHARRLARSKRADKRRTRPRARPPHSRRRIAHCRGCAASGPRSTHATHMPDTCQIWRHGLSHQQPHLSHSGLCTWTCLDHLPRPTCMRRQLSL